MTTRQRLALVALVAVSLIFAGTCAPVQPPTPSSKSSTLPAATKAEPEPVLVLPAPQPAGPRSRILAAIDQVRERDLLTTNSFWTVFHGILGLGPASTTLRHPETGLRVNALDYIASGGELRGLQFLPTRYGLDVQMGPLSVGQGHQDQFVAEMAQWGVPADKKFRVLDKEFTFMDFVRHTQMRARVTEKQELSWAIVVLGQYLGTDISWTNAAGEKLHFEDLVRYELDANIEQAPCGGTHRLFGLTWVYQLHLARGGKPTGVWQEIAVKTGKYRDLARQYQNPDGSFSTDFFRGPGHAADKQMRINSTGHILEWLALALSDAELKEPWMENAASALAVMILDLRDAPIEGGSLYHAAHGLILYAARVFGPEVLGPNQPYLPARSVSGAASPAKAP